MKRKTLRERADAFAKWNCQWIIEDKSHHFSNSSGSWLAGYRAGKREGKAEAMKDCGFGSKT